MSAPGRPQALTSERFGRKGSGVALACALALGGCAINPYNYISPQLNTFGAKDDATRPEPVARLAGNLHQAQAALLDQRRRLWEAAGDTEAMKNATALGLIGVGAAALYRGLDSELNRRWLARAGIGGAAVLGGANWLEPNARQKIYLGGATALTCLALATAPYEMAQADFDAMRKTLTKARGTLEQAFTALRTVGLYEYRSHEAKVISGAWRKARFADSIITVGERLLGSIEQVGPRLHGLTVAQVDKVNTQVALVSKDLGQLGAALAALKPNTNLIAGSAVFELPEEPADEPAAAPATPAAAGQPERSAACPAAKAASAAEPKKVLTTEQKAEQQAQQKADQAEQAERKAAFAKALEASAAWRAERIARVVKELGDLSNDLGQIVSMVRRVEAARTTQGLPEQCGAAPMLRLVPDQRSIVLRPNGSFQFMLAGDEGAPRAQFVGDTPPAGVLDLSIPIGRAANTVRLTAGTKVDDETQTIVRISDSRNVSHYEVSVKVCKGG